jgi:hypothetical protein
MDRLYEVLIIIIYFLLLPFSILKGSKKEAYIKIKKMMIAANLL